jgi:hypothetical protein
MVVTTGQIPLTQLADGALVRVRQQEPNSEAPGSAPSADHAGAEAKTAARLSPAGEK